MIKEKVEINGREYHVKYNPEMRNLTARIKAKFILDGQWCELKNYSKKMQIDEIIKNRLDNQ